MTRLRKSADRIREEISIVTVLVDYGYDVDARGEDREQQFSCDLHGDGQDNTPSARCYPGTGQFYCFACGRSRDALALVQEKENLTFWEAVRSLEKRYGLEPLPWEPGDDERPPSLNEVVEASLDRSETPDQALHRLERFLDGMTRDKTLSAQKCAGFWEAFDRVRLFQSNEGPPGDVLAMAHKILAKAKAALHIKATT